MNESVSTVLGYACMHLLARRTPLRDCTWATRTRNGMEMKQIKRIERK